MALRRQILSAIFIMEVATISKEVRINDNIRAKEVRVIGENGEQLDIMPLSKALELAANSGYDLVEIAPNSNPPVCRVMDYGKFKFDQSKKEKEAKKKQKTITLKEMKLRLGIEDHDFKVKAKNIEKFLNEGHKVKVTIMFRGREMSHPELGEVLCRKLADYLKDVATVEKMPKHEGRNMIMMLAPKVA